VSDNRRATRGMSVHMVNGPDGIDKIVFRPEIDPLPEMAAIASR